MIAPERPDPAAGLECQLMANPSRAGRISGTVGMHQIADIPARVAAQVPDIGAAFLQCRPLPPGRPSATHDPNRP